MDLRACMVHKFHMALHFAEFLEIWGWLPNCTVLERKNRTFRYYASLHTVQKSFESFVLRDLTFQHVADLSSQDLFAEHVSLVGGSQPKKALLRKLQQTFGEGLVYLTARKARVNR